MTRASFIFALLAAGLMSAGTAQAGPPDAEALGFKGARLGMSLETWRQAAFPGAPNPRVAPSCQGDGGKAGVTRASTSPAQRTQVCAYVTRYGSTVLTEDVPWTADLLAKSPRYVFTDGRLSRIDIHVGIDAFDKVMARMKSRYGAPVRMARDLYQARSGAVPRVTVRWKTADGAVELVDPGPDLANMTISFIARPDGGAPTTAG